MSTVEQVAAAVLYEGYLLWPYRRSALKNRKRWTLGGVYPRAFSEAGGGHDPWFMQTQCLVVGAAPVVHVRVRFLQVVERQVRRAAADGALDYVDELQVGENRYLAWEEAIEREILVECLRINELRSSGCVEIAIPAGCDQEPLTASDGGLAGALVRRWKALEGVVEASAECVQPQVTRLTVRVSNTTPWDGPDRESALARTFVSAHAILRVEGGEFVSLMDPPEALKPAAAGCENVKIWPVLAGEEDEKRTMLASPIILYDYPQIAPESPGDLFDAAEIDQLLTLNILTLTDEEKEEMRASDPRAREILERTEALTSDDFMQMHGAIREFRTLHAETDLDPFAALQRPAPSVVVVRGVEVRPGSRVRLCPRGGADLMDLALAGRSAVVEAIEQDFEDRLYLAVSVEDDPGRDLGTARMPGHRFFFSPDEVEPLDC